MGAGVSVHAAACSAFCSHPHLLRTFLHLQSLGLQPRGVVAVSYTPLTLPTTREA